MTVHEKIGATLTPSDHLFDLFVGGWEIPEMVGGDVVELDDFVVWVHETVHFLE
jgi:hypothetical protein